MNRISFVILLSVTSSMAGGADAQSYDGYDSLYLDILPEVPIQLRITDKLNKNSEILSLRAFSARKFDAPPYRLILPMKLNCRKLPGGKISRQYREIDFQISIDGIRYSRSVSGNFCSETEEGIRLIDLSVCKFSAYCDRSNQITVYHEIYNPDH